MSLLLASLVLYIIYTPWSWPFVVFSIWLFLSILKELVVYLIKKINNFLQRAKKQ